MMKEPEHLHRRRGWGSWDCSDWRTKKLQRENHAHVSVPERDPERSVKMAYPDSSLQCPVTGWEVTGTNKKYRIPHFNTRQKTPTTTTPPKHLYDSMFPGCTMRLWNVRSNPDRTWTCATCATNLALSCMILKVLSNLNNSNSLIPGGKTQC